MTPRQWRRFLAWCGFSVALPLVAYLATFIIGFVEGNAFGVIVLLARGDVLFLAVVLLTLVADGIAEDLLLTPRTQANEQTWAYAGLIVTLLLLVLTTLLYGWVLTLGLPPRANNRPPDGVMASLCGGWLVGSATYCGVYTYRLLCRGRLV